MSKHNKRPDPTTPEAMAAYEAEMQAAMKRQYAGLGAMFSTFTADPPPPYTLFGLTRSAEPNTAEGAALVAKLARLVRLGTRIAAAAENARLRRRIEDMERKGKKR